MYHKLNSIFNIERKKRNALISFHIKDVFVFTYYF